jgi:hypothetical protein
LCTTELKSSFWESSLCSQSSTVCCFYFYLMHEQLLPHLAHLSC